MPNIRRNIEDLVNDPRGYLTMLADRLRDSSRGRQAVANREGLGYRNLSQEERAQQMTQAVLDNLGGGGLGIIKSKGGNWLTGSVENALSGLKKPLTSGIEDLKEYLTVARAESPELVPRYERELALRTQGDALNNWIEGPLTKYVKRDMATEGDPVRKLAEQGVLHFEPPMQSMYNREVLERIRGRTGNLPKGVSSSDLAKSWENASDLSIDPTAASLYRGNPTARVMQENPWLSKLAPEDLVYEARTNFDRDLGLSHLTDELSNALNPESGLPRNLLLTPEQMQQMGMEKAVRHVDAINKWRAAQKAEADALKANNAATVLHKEYPENNPRGLRWVELKAPSELPEGWQYREKSGNYIMPDGTVTGTGPQERALADQLKYEGDTMGHCVGGYCDDVLSGRSRIFSLRDAKGEPHVTIETRPQYFGGRPMEEVLAERGSKPEEAHFANPEIVQIKGKQNKAPNPEYLPFVQDFVKSGKWSDVGDLSNAGLYRHHVAKYPESVADLGEYATKEEIENWVANHAKPEFAQGGSVKSTTWRPMELDGIIGYITE